MQVRNQLPVIVLALILTACGGGSEDPTDVNSPPPDAQISRSSSSSSSSSSLAPDGIEPTAHIVFPTTQSASGESQVTIRGFAADASGIRSIHVNGHKATLLNSASSSSALEDVAEETAWEVTLPLEAGENIFTLEVVDNSGETATLEDQGTVFGSLQIPTTFSFDPGTQSLYGFAPHDVVEVNLDSGKEKVLVDRWSTGFSGCLHAASSSYYYLTLSSSDSYALYRVTLNNEPAPTLVGQFPIDDDRHRFTHELVCDSQTDSLYFLLNARLAEEQTYYSTIYQRSLSHDAPWNLLYETQSSEFKVDHLIDNDDVLIAYSRADKRLYSISKLDGTSTTLFDDYPSYVLNLVHGSTQEDVYVTTFDGIEHVNVDDQQITTLGEVDPGDPLKFTQPGSTHLDPANQRFLVGDSDYKSIIAIDQITGERSIALSDDLGSGPKLVAIRDITVNQDETYAYALDDGGNASEKVLEIDLSNGERRLLGDINSDSNLRVAGLELDEMNNELYAATRDSVYRIDLATNTTTTLARSESTPDSALSAISAIALDKQSGRLFIADGGSRQILALDVTTRDITLVSGENRGEGQGFLGINGLVFDPETNLLYASNQGHGNVHSIDPATGNREEIATTCAPSSIDGELDMIMSFNFDPALNDLLLVGDRITRINLDEPTCQYERYGSALSVAPLTENRLLVGAFGVMKLIDEKTGEVVIVSQ